jgi:hypothetical protein
MTDKNKHLRVVIVDRSGSMQSIQRDMDGGLRAFVKEQAAQPGETLFTIVEFDDYADLVCKNAQAQDVDYTLVPRGLTALYDAVGYTIKLVGADLAALPEDERPGDVVVLIITDGLENRSQEYTQAQVRELVTHQSEKYGWQFTYLGSNQDAVLVGRGLGVSAESSLTYDGAATQDSFVVASAMVSRGTESGVYAYSGEERTTASGIKP